MITKLFPLKNRANITGTFFRALEGRQRRNRALTGAHGRVVAGAVFAQGSCALGGEGGGGTQAGAALPALSTADRAGAPG